MPSMLFIPPMTLPAAEWTQLDYCKCRHCPLNSRITPRCPVAVNIQVLTAQFAFNSSMTLATITVETEDRTYLKRTQLQEGLHSIMGLIMATSGCPHLDFLRPLARFHLPFANSTEAKMRSISFYLMEQYFLIHDYKRLTINLAELDLRYQRINEVNKGIINRIADVAEGDATKNAIVILNSLAQLLSMELQSNLDEVRQIFE